MVNEGSLMFQFLVSYRIMQGGMEKLIDFIFGACEASSTPAVMQLPCKTKGVGYKTISFPGSLPAPAPVPHCPPQGHELLPEDIPELRKWWYLLLLGMLVLLFEGPELLLQLVDLYWSMVHGIRCLTSLLLHQAKSLCSIAHHSSP